MMPKKRNRGNRDTRAEAARKRATEIAIEVGKQQTEHRKALREIEASTPKVKRSRYYDLGPTQLFAGGRKENSQAENADDAFTAEDLMLSRRAITDKESGLVLHKKGQTKFRGWAGGLKAANEEKLAPYRGKKILLIVHYEKNKNGVTTTHSIQREIVYTDYPALVAEYRDSFRAETFDIDSDAAYGVTSVEFSPPVEVKRKRTKKRKGTQKKAEKRKRKKKQQKRSRSIAHRRKR